MSRRRIWCETAPPEALAAPSTVALLRRFSVAPILAVWPRTAASIGAIAARFEDAGLPVALWPMIADEDGRWLHAANVGLFADFVERLADDLRPRELVFDLEPAIEEVRKGLASGAVHAQRLSPAPDPATFTRGRDALAALSARLSARGVVVSAAPAPMVLFDPPAGPPAWQERLGTPVDGIAWDHVSPMLYTSIIEGWSRGALSRADVRSILGTACQASAARFGGARAGASLGAVGTGAFGDEPTYRSPAELADDVAIARAAGVDDLALFDLGGVLARAPAEAWLSAFAKTPAAARLPEPTLKWRAILAGATAAGSVVGALERARAKLWGDRRRG